MMVVLPFEGTTRLCSVRLMASLLFLSKLVAEPFMVVVVPSIAIPLLTP